MNYSVGAYDVTNTIASFSSRGAGENGTVKPNISAPGVNIRSSLPGDTFGSYNGTSMAAPHVAGAVALPARELVLATEPAPTVPPSGRDRPLLITSRSSQPYSAMIVEESLRCDTVTLGSAGAKAMSVVLGEADIYVHDGGMNQWDSAAPVAVALAAGLHASRINGAPFSYNDADTYMPDLLICRPELADPVLDSLWGNRRPR